MHPLALPTLNTLGGSQIPADRRSFPPLHVAVIVPVSLGVESVSMTVAPGSSASAVAAVHDDAPLAHVTFCAAQAAQAAQASGSPGSERTTPHPTATIEIKTNPTRIIIGCLHWRYSNFWTDLTARKPPHRLGS